MSPTTTIIVAVVGLLGTVFGAAVGTGGLYAWFKLGPERNKIKVDVAKIETDLHSAILKDAEHEHSRISDELVQVRMEVSALEHQHDECRRELISLQATIASQQIEFARHARMAELSRAKAHLALNALGNYELHIASLLDIMRDHDVRINPEMRPHRLRANLQAEMNTLEQLEIEAVRQPEHPPQSE